MLHLYNYLISNEGCKVIQPCRWKSAVIKDAMNKGVSGLKKPIDPFSGINPIISEQEYLTLLLIVDIDIVLQLDKLLIPTDAIQTTDIFLLS